MEQVPFPVPTTVVPIVSPSSSARLAAARTRLNGVEPPILIVAASRAAADEFALALAADRGATFGVSRAGFTELAARLAIPALARQGLSPSAPLGDEAVAARVTFDAREDGALEYFEPVAGMPGFPRALGRTLADLRMAGVGSASLTGHAASRDLATLLDRAIDERDKAGAVDFATMLKTATEEIRQKPQAFRERTVVMLDVAISSKAEADFAHALIAAAGSAIVTIPSGDARTLQALAAGSTGSTGSSGSSGSSLSRLQNKLFAGEQPEAGAIDESVVLFSAPGEGREAVEIARRILQEAARGVPFDDIAVLLRAPQTYLGVLEHALDRAGIPVWFHRGTRRPDPAGRALLALLACADEQLSARRFAEYVSLGQVPLNEAGDADVWSPPADDLLEAVLPPDDRAEDTQPEEDAKAATMRGETFREVAGTLRAPWRWEDLIVEAAVIGGLDRWQRRLAGLAHEYDRRLREATSDDPDASRARAIRRDREQLQALRSFAEPVLSEMSSWPADQPWGQWLDALKRLAPRVISQPARVLRVLQELAPLSAIGPVRLREVRDVLTPRLSTLTHEPPRRRHGRVFVGTPHASRGRSFRVVFVPGLAERMFPQRIREDALLPDDRREATDPALATQPLRAADERLQLTLAAGAASERLYVSYPRIELNESRPRVPSFYVLDILRAIEGVIPAAAEIGTRAFQSGASTLAWPAPRDPAIAIDDFEHDLATMGGLLAAGSGEVKGRARYLYELSPELQRSLTARWLRWHRRQWDAADGLVRVVTETTAPALAAQRLGNRPYSLTALQRFAACPYQFLIAAVYRLAPLEEPAPLQQLDPLTRGDLFHRFQAAALRRLQADGLLPLSQETLPRAQQLLAWAIKEVDDEAYDRLNPAIERVWRDEIAAITQDLKFWLEHLAEEGAQWTPERFEFAFGLTDTAGRDERSTPEPALVDGRFRLRGSIDLIERHRQTGFLRVTDHKTGRNRTKSGETIVEGGRVLQPVIYGLALEALEPNQTVYSGRLSFCTSVGGFTQHEIPLLGDSRRRGLEVLEIIDRAIEGGLLAARPAADACTFCDFQVVCGRDEERRTRRKDAALFADLDALRKLP
ncbi:MAG: exodeoxyribonuclease V subunit gamma [Acidobacteriota bacterium]|nr:exodeoxyribonuclease V subunit gamma [Acidobacteriota bacterium]